MIRIESIISTTHSLEKDPPRELLQLQKGTNVALQHLHRLYLLGVCEMRKFLAGQEASAAGLEANHCLFQKKKQNKGGRKNKEIIKQKENASVLFISIISYITQHITHTYRQTTLQTNDIYRSKLGLHQSLQSGRGGHAQEHARPSKTNLVVSQTHNPHHFRHHLPALHKARGAGCIGCENAKALAELGIGHACREALVCVCVGKKRKKEVGLLRGGGDSEEKPSSTFYCNCCNVIKPSPHLARNTNSLKNTVAAQLLNHQLRVNDTLSGLGMSI